MKKFLTLVLALVMVLAIAVPAMAFTTATPAASVPYELDIYLVEYSDDGFFTSFTSLPPADRGYAKNEVVASVVEVYAPKNKNIVTAFPGGLTLSGKNVTLNVADNNIVSSATTLKTTLATGLVFTYDGDLTATLSSAMFSTTKAVTTKFLFFAKVTGDSASLSAELDASDEEFTASVTSITVLDDYTVTKAGKTYTVADKATTPTNLFKILVGDKNKSTDLIVFDGTDEYTVAVAADKTSLVFVKGTTQATGAVYNRLMAIYEDYFVDEFGFDFFLLGGVVNDDTFYALNGTNDLKATVDIKPWTAYVTVPDNIVVDPPKTGDAASIMGFVMIVLAAAAAVVVKKVRA